MLRNKKVLLILFLIFLFLLIFLPGYSRYQQLLAKNRELVLKIGNLKKENEKLAKEEYMLKKDPSYAEKVAREKMGLTKEGEVLYKVVEEK